MSNGPVGVRMGGRRSDSTRHALMRAQSRAQALLQTTRYVHLLKHASGQRSMTQQGTSAVGQLGRSSMGTHAAPTEAAAESASARHVAFVTNTSLPATAGA